MKKMLFILRASSKNMITALILLFVSISCFLFGSFQFINLFAFQNEYRHAGMNDYQLKMRDEMESSNYTLLDNEKKFINQLLVDEEINNISTVNSLPVISYHLNPVDASEEKNQENFMLMFYSDDALIDDFVAQNRVLIDGGPLNGMVDNECLISEELARSNNLKVGSVLTFLHPSNWNLNFYFRVVGIYQDYTTPKLDHSDISRRNEIISSETVLNKTIQRYAGQVEIPVHQTFYFSMSTHAAERMIPLLPTRFELINGDQLYDLNLNLFNRYRQLNYLLLLSAVVIGTIAMYLIIFKCMPKWIHLAKLHRISGMQTDLLIKRAVAYCYGGVIVLPLITVSIIYNPLNYLLLEKFVKHRGLFSDNTNGILITQKMLAYYEALQQQFYCELNHGSVTLLAFILSIIFMVSVKILARKIQKRKDVMIKIRPVQLKYGQVDEMVFECFKSYLIYGENQEFKQEFKEYLINSLINSKKKLFIISSKTILCDENTILDNIMYLTDCSKENVETFCQTNHFDEKLLCCKMQELAYEDKIWMQLLCALMMDVQVILFDHLFKDDGLRYQKIKAVINENNHDICVINFSELRHPGEHFDEIWQVKDRRCLFIK